MRLEKSIGIWNGDFRASFTPAMTGLDRWVAAEKPDFIGRDAYLSAAPSPTVMMMLEVDALDADAGGFSPIWHEGRKVGYTTTGGYGHRTRRSLALAQIERSLAVVGTELTLDVVGMVRPAKVIAMSPYDPTGGKMRA